MPKVGEVSVGRKRLGRPPVPEKDRFFKRLNKEDGPIHPIHGKCWVLNTYSGEKPSPHRNSRMAWRVQCGHIPEELQVLHKCDNPACVRHEHLFLGTISDNVRDAVSKGRKPGFVGNQHALGHVQSEEARKIKSHKSKAFWNRKKSAGDSGFKLTDQQVKDILTTYRRETYLKSNAKELANKYGISVTHVNRLVLKHRRTTRDTES